MNQTQERKNTMSTPTKDEIESRAQALLEHDIFCCDSALVDDLLKLAGELPSELGSNLASGFSIEEIENFYPDPSDWTEDQCRVQLNYDGIGPAADAEWGLGDWQQAVRDNADAAEIYEWWQVSSRLCEELRAIGEPVIDNDYGYWWGRTCTSQQIMSDGTLQKVALRILAK